MEPGRKLILTTILVTATFTAFAMAGFAERWYSAWINNMFLALTVAAIQAISICCLIFFRKSISQANIMKIFRGLTNHNFAATIIAGLLLSFIIAAYVDFACGAFFIFGEFIFLSFWLLQGLFAFIPAWRKRLTRPQAIFNLTCLSLGVPIAYILYYFIVHYNLFQSLYSYSYSDRYLPTAQFTIHPTELYFPKIMNLLLYSIIIFIPWGIKLLCMSIRIIFLKFRTHTRIHL